MKSRKVLKEVKKWLKDNINDSENLIYNEAMVYDNQNLLDYIRKLEKLPDVKGGYNPYIYKPTVEVPAPEKYRDWSVQEVYEDLKFTKPRSIKDLEGVKDES